MSAEASHQGEASGHEDAVAPQLPAPDAANSGSDMQWEGFVGGTIPLAQETSPRQEDFLSSSDEDLEEGEIREEGEDRAEDEDEDEGSGESSQPASPGQHGATATARETRRRLSVHVTVLGQRFHLLSTELEVSQAEVIMPDPQSEQGGAGPRWPWIMLTPRTATPATRESPTNLAYYDHHHHQNHRGELVVFIVHGYRYEFQPEELETSEVHFIFPWSSDASGSAPDLAHRPWVLLKPKVSGDEVFQEEDDEEEDESESDDDIEEEDEEGGDDEEGERKIDDDDDDTSGKHDSGVALGGSGSEVRSTGSWEESSSPTGANEGEGEGEGEVTPQPAGQYFQVNDFE
ncbi:hypothetical protein JDV02_009404 [Purpureocillium takamizusanense]|uniref:Uncharacterized protein n=1 Tax=Purpureocillium takamizusanense TaxID=2060973 RepID=A0A9Q8QRU9_9HYPO|nr:uncharacterized protein JDV02_009404 [Purpureocillium takamizusanense]UNI23594.1 hypothetical protein JDV02_009404 [Purpureocillium takamizusanense]